MSEPNSNRNRARGLLHKSLRPYLLFCQLLCSAPYPVESLQRIPEPETQRGKTYFKQARFLLTASVVSYVVVCCIDATIELVDVPMPFFTGVLYVNEVILGVFISLLTSVRSYKKGLKYDRFVEGILSVATALHPFEWNAILSSVQLSIRLISTAIATVFGLCMVFDLLHFGSIYALLFSLGAYVLPNMLVALSFLQCCFGMLLVYKLLQSVRQRLAGAGRLTTQCDLMQRVAETERHYLQLIACMELVTQSFEWLIVVNTFAGINVTSLQLLEIYQHLHQSASNELYIIYNLFWIVMQLCLLLMILYPCHLVKREQSRVGLMMFQLSQHNDARIDSKIARFSILTLNRKDVSYTACGILKLELSSLSSIFVALLSFMIILIQFDSANLNKHKGTVTTMDSLYNSI